MDKKEKDEKALSEPDPETLHTTDPQEKMKGPISSTMQKINDEAQEGNEETKRGGKDR